MTTQAPPVQRPTLAQIDVRSAQATRQLDRILPTAGDHERRASTFSSAL